MSHIVKSCPLTKMNGGLSQLHSVDEDAVLWLTSYGSRNAYKKKKKHKCVSKTDTNPPFAFQIAFPRGTDFAGFLGLQGESKSRDLQSEISVRIESRIVSADSRLQLQC